MGKNLWLVAGLTFVGFFSLAVWRWSLDREVETEGRSAAIETLDTRPGDQEEPAPPPPEATANPAPPATNTASPLKAVSGPSSDSAQAEYGGDIDVRWRAAAGLPDQVREQLKSSDDPRFQELLQRNARLVRARADDSWGPDMQDRMNELFESMPESGNMLITVACREMQCQVQTVNTVQPPAGSTTQAQVLFDELRQQWWFRDQLTLAQGHVTTVNGRLYHLQYFDRKQ